MMPSRWSLPTVDSAMKPMPPCTWIAARVIESQLSVARYFASGVNSRIWCLVALVTRGSSSARSASRHRLVALRARRAGSRVAVDQRARRGTAARGCPRARAPCARAGSSSAAGRRSACRTACARASSAIASSTAASAMPTPCAATPSRALFIRSSMALKPSPFTPMRHASARSKRTTAVGEPWMPSLCSSRSTRDAVRARRRAACAGTGTATGPWSCPSTARSVSASRASTRWISAPPLVMKIFWPSRK